MTELKTYYLNSSPDGTCYNGQGNQSTPCDFSETGLKQEGRDLIDDALYYLGGGSSISLYPHEFYNNEHGENVYVEHKTRWTGKVGIMYPSDYIYATDLSLCQKK